MTSTRSCSSAGSAAVSSAFMRGFWQGTRGPGKLGWAVSRGVTVRAFYLALSKLTWTWPGDGVAPATMFAGPEQWSSPADSDSDGINGRNHGPRGANTVNDTRALLNRIAEFRQRLESMPRLIPVATASTPQEAPSPRTESESRTQSILEQSIRQLVGSTDAVTVPPALVNRARR